MAKHVRMAAHFTVIVVMILLDLLAIVCRGGVFCLLRHLRIGRQRGV